MKTTALTSRSVKTILGLVLILFLTIIFYSESFFSGKHVDSSDRTQEHAIQRSHNFSYPDTYMAKADSTNDYINIIGMTCMNPEGHSILCYSDEEETEDSESIDVNKKNLITAYLADNKSILKNPYQISALKCADQYLI